MVTQNYTISTVKNAVPPRVKMSQYDTGSRTIVFSVVDGSGTAVDLTGLSVTVEGTRIDGHAFATACTVDDNTAAFTESVDMTNAAGDHPAELVIRESGQRLGTMNFVISVEPCAMDEGANLTNEDLPLYQQLFKGLASAPMIYNGASGSTASFPDGADGYPLKSLTVAVEPVQDLHGYDNPWPAAGGKNIVPLNIANIKSLNTDGTWSENVYSYSGISFTINTDDGGNIVSIKANGTPSRTAQLVLSKSIPVTAYTNYIVSGLNTGASTSSFDYRLGHSDDSYWINIRSESETITPTESTITMRISVIANYTATNVMFYPMIRLATETDATFAPYSNICPISGRTEAKVTRIGKNFLENTATTRTINGVTFTVNSDGTVVANGTATGSAIFALNDATFIADSPSGTYVLNGCPSGGSNSSYRMSIVGASGSDVGQGVPVVYSETITDTTARILIVSGYTCNNLTFKPMIRLASETDATYEPYSGNTYTISLGETVYGGTLDVVGGKMVVDRAMYQPTGNEANYVQQTGRIAFPLPTEYRVEGSVDRPCSTFRVITAGTYCYVYTDMTIDELKSYLQQNDVQIVVGLTTPIEIALTPTQINTLLGANNIYSDAGSISEVEYPADTKRFILNAIASALA